MILSWDSVSPITPLHHHCPQYLLYHLHFAIHPHHIPNLTNSLFLFGLLFVINSINNLNILFLHSLFPPNLLVNWQSQALQNFLMKRSLISTITFSTISIEPIETVPTSKHYEPLSSNSTKLTCKPPQFALFLQQLDTTHRVFDTILI